MDDELELWDFKPTIYRDQRAVDAWTETIEKEGLDYVELQRRNLDEEYRAGIEVAIDKYKNKQIDKRYDQQQERDLTALNIAEKANDISKESNTLAKWAIGISLLAIGISALSTIWVAFFQN